MSAKKLPLVKAAFSIAINSIKLLIRKGQKAMHLLLPG